MHDKTRQDNTIRAKTIQYTRIQNKPIQYKLWQEMRIQDKARQYNIIQDIIIQHQIRQYNAIQYNPITCNTIRQDTNIQHMTNTHKTRHTNPI